MRQVRLEQVLLETLQSLLRDEVQDGRAQRVRLLGLTLSPDGGHARIAYAVVGALEQERELAHHSREGLARASGFLRARLASLLALKKLPKLGFTFVGVTEEQP